MSTGDASSPPSEGAQPEGKGASPSAGTAPAEAAGRMELGEIAPRARPSSPGSAPSPDAAASPSAPPPAAMPTPKALPLDAPGAPGALHPAELVNVSEVDAAVLRSDAGRAQDDAEPAPSPRELVRELWDATTALRVAQPGGLVHARTLLHARAVELALGELSPAGREQNLAALLQWMPEDRAQLARAALAGDTLLTEAHLDAVAEAHRQALELLERDALAAARDRDLAWIRRAAVVLAVLAAALFAWFLVQKWRAPENLAAGKPWTTSSKAMDCHPEIGMCDSERNPSFFYTREEQNPWFQLDLGAPTHFSSLTVVNRDDMLIDRAVPLVVELSDDGKSFREVARQKDPFVTWRPELGAQTARYVRLRIDRFASLHLVAVEVHP